MRTFFDIQGHRGTRGLRPENTLPSFELAIDLGVTSIETDVHLTRDDVPVLTHDPTISSRLCEMVDPAHAPALDQRPLIRSLSLEQLRCYRACRNPDPQRFPEQQAVVSPLAQAMAPPWEMDPFAVPTLAQLLAFADAYQGEPGRAVGKSDQQRAAARRLRFDLELKRVPFYPDSIGDGFDGVHPGVLEKKVVEAARAAGAIERTVVRSFDHRSVRLVRNLEPRLTTAVLIAGTAPVRPSALARQAEADVYCPEFACLDRDQVRECHAEGIRVVPWTVNETVDMRRLLEWQVDGMTTDYPDRLAPLVQTGSFSPAP